MVRPAVRVRLTEVSGLTRRWTMGKYVAESLQVLGCKVDLTSAQPLHAIEEFPDQTVLTAAERLDSTSTDLFLSIDSAREVVIAIEEFEVGGCEAHACRRLDDVQFVGRPVLEYHLLVDAGRVVSTRQAVDDRPVRGDFAQFLKNVARSTCFAVDEQIDVRHSVSAAFSKRASDCSAKTATVLCESALQSLQKFILPRQLGLVLKAVELHGRMHVRPDVGGETHATEGAAWPRKDSMRSILQRPSGTCRSKAAPTRG